MRAGLSKSTASDRVRNPAEDVQIVLDIPMEVDHKNTQSAPLPADGKYCNFCGTNSLSLQKCETCGAKVCQMENSGTGGCVLGGGTMSPQGFLCPHCVRTKSHEGQKFATEVGGSIKPA